MSRDYYKEMRACPYFRFVQSKNDAIGRGFWGCRHPSPNIGEDLEAPDHVKRARENLKSCIHGKLKNEQQRYSCRIATIQKNSEIQTTLQEFS